MANRQVLLLGNGLNRCYEKASWETLIREVQSQFDCPYTYEQLEGLPFSMQIVAASGDKVDQAMKYLSGKMIDDSLCNEQRALLERLLALPFDTLLTANYTFELEQALGCPAGQGMYKKAVRYTKACTPREKQFGLYKRFEVNGRAVWHIHGDLLAPRSVIMGQYSYGKALREYQNYIAAFMRRYRAAPDAFLSRGWLDDFMLGDVHILGLGMGIAETDLWWLLNCKKRNMPDADIYYYTPSFEQYEKRDIMLETYGVRIVRVPVSEKDYKRFYGTAIEEAEKRINEGR